jgi:lipopolysaccharide biosynthesis glycosyltransferase
MNLLFSINEAYLSVFENCLRSILSNGGYEHYDVYILQNDISIESQKNLEECYEQVSFFWMNVDTHLFDGLPLSERYPVQIYFRLAAPMLLPKNLERILYLDGDVLVINSLKELYETDFEGNYLAACTHTGTMLTNFNHLRLQTGQDVPYINSGVMLYNLPLLREHLSLDALKAYAKGHELLLFLPDQDLLTALYGQNVKLLDACRYNLGERALRMHELDPTKSSLSKEWIRQNTSIIHYYGKHKPWKNPSDSILDAFYHEVLHPKTLYMVAGTMGIGKSSVCRAMLDQLEHAVFLDGDWCWYGKEWIVNDSTKAMVIENIAFLLNQFIHEESYENVVFCWVMDLQSIWDDILSRLDLKKVQVVSCALICSPEQLERNILLDAKKGLRKKEQVQASLARLDHYNYIDALQLDISGMSLSEAAKQVIALKKGRD